MSVNVCVAGGRGGLVGVVLTFIDEKTHVNDFSDRIFVWG